MSDAKHTPLPWFYAQLHDGWVVCEPDGFVAARQLTESNAKKIVRAVNAHYDLLAVAKEAHLQITTGLSTGELILRQLADAIAKAEATT